MGQNKFYLLEGVLTNGAILMFEAQFTRGTHATQRSSETLSRWIGVGMLLVEVVHKYAVRLLNSVLITLL